VRTTERRTFHSRTKGRYRSCVRCEGAASSEGLENGKRIAWLCAFCIPWFLGGGK
jgi:hypothetical protein